MRTFLSELGCLPVSAMIHVPNAADVFDADGSVQPGEDKPAWYGYFGRTFNQLVWWAAAARRYKTEIDPHRMTAAFKTDPSGRDAP